MVDSLFRTPAVVAAAATLVLSSILAAPAAAQPPQVPANGPVADFLKQIFGLDDDGAPIGEPRAVVRELRQEDRLVAEERWDDAVDALQFILDQPEDVPLDPSQGSSLKREAERRIQRLPPEGRRVYSLRFDALAAAELDAARSAGDIARTAAVAGRYLNTPAGEAAADEIADLLADGGDLLGAALWLWRLKEQEAPLCATLDWRFKTADILRRLNDSQRARVLLSDPRLDPAAVADRLGNRTVAEWSEDSGAWARGTPSVGDEWWMPFGNARRGGSSRSGAPVLLRDWECDYTRQPAVIEQVRVLEEALADEDVPTLPVGNCVASGGRVVWRTARGVEAVDAATGDVVWRRGDRPSVDDLLASRSPGAAEGGPAIAPLVLDSYDSHPLPALLYLDGVAAQVTSDGRQVFVVEQRAPLLNLDNDVYLSHPLTDELEARDSTVNALTSYDLATGRRRWTIGGPASSEPFAPALTGVYFFGPPTPADGSLFVVGVERSDVTLFVLDAATGGLLWSQVLGGLTGPGVVEDAAVRMGDCPITVTAGLVLCPMNSGQLAAVDRLTRRIAWVSAGPGADGAGREGWESYYDFETLRRRWPRRPAFPSGRAIVFAASDGSGDYDVHEPSVTALDGLTGQELWSRPKSDAAAVLGVFGDHVLLLYPDRLAGLAISRRGVEVWSAPFESGVRPAGAGAATEDAYWLPMTNGAIQAYSLATGEQVGRVQDPTLAGRLGSLVFAQGRLLSAGPQGLLSFRQRPAAESEVRSRLAADPKDPLGHWLQAELALADGETPQALESLRQAAQGAPAGSVLAARVAARRTQTLLTIVRGGLAAGAPGDADAEWAELRELEGPDLPQGARLALEAERALARKDLDAAWAAAQELIGLPEDVIVEEDGWSAPAVHRGVGLIRRIWQASEGESRARFDSEIAAALERAVAEGPASSALAERRYAFHPRAEALGAELAETAGRAARWAEADLRWREQLRRSDGSGRARALQRLAELWRDAGSPADSAAWARELEATLPDAVLEGGAVGREWARTWIESLGPLPRIPDSSTAWTGWTGAVHRLAEPDSPHDNGDAFPIEGRPSEWLRRRRVLSEVTWRGLSFIDKADQDIEWREPLLSGYDWWRTAGARPAWTQGGILAVARFGAVNVLSLAERRTLWSRPLPGHFLLHSPYDVASADASGVPARNSEELRQEFASAVGEDSAGGCLLAQSGRWLAVVGRHELIVFDILTGAEQWRRRGLSAQAMLLGDSSAEAFAVTAAEPDDRPRAFDAATGERLPADVLAEHLDSVIGARGDRLLCARPAAGWRRLIGSADVELSAVGPVSGDVAWRRKFPAGTRFARIRFGELAAVSPDGRLDLLDLWTGELQKLGSLPPDRRDAENIVLLADDHRVYADFRTGHEHDFEDYYGLGVLHVRPGETLMAFDRQQGKLLWRQRTGGANLISEHFDGLPVLLLLKRQQTPRLGFDLMTTSVEVLDKRTGEVLVRWSAPGGDDDSFSEVEFDRDGGWIQLRGYGSRLRVQFDPARVESP